MLTPTLMHLSQPEKSFKSSEGETFHMRILNDRVGKDGRSYTMPATSQIVALILSDFHRNMNGRDIFIKEKTFGRLQRIKENHIFLFGSTVSYDFLL